MKWNKKHIPLVQLPALTNTLKQMIQQGDERLEKMRCVFRQTGTDIYFIFTPYDFIDLDPKPQIETFFLYQAFTT